MSCLISSVLEEGLERRHGVIEEMEPGGDTTPHMCEKDAYIEEGHLTFRKRACLPAQ